MCILIQPNGTLFSFNQMNKFYSTLLRLLNPDPILFWAYLLPIFYWIYLTLTTNFVLVFDSEGYYALARLFYDGHWSEYFRSGPSREPLYPLVIAASMYAGKWLGISYTYPLKIFSFGFLAATMFLIQQILRIINTNRWIQAATILYTGFSPILINSALCLYSEIVTFPWLVGAVLTGIYFVRSLRPSQPPHFSASIGLGICFLGFTFVKGMGEILAPLFFCWLIFYGWRQSVLKILPFLRQSKIKILLVLFVFYSPLLLYKSLNYTFNNHFVLTNRMDMALYGNLNLRAKSPLTMDNFLNHLSTVPVSYDLCPHFFHEKCSHWTMSSSDETYLTREDQLNKQNLTSAQNEKIIHQETLRAFFGHPIAQCVFLAQEGMKMFFWETTRGAFVSYPPWLENLFNVPCIVILTSLGVGIFCLGGFLIACTLLKNELVLITFVLTSLLIVSFSFVFIIHRYTIIAAPLMILLNASCLSVVVSAFFASKVQKNH